MEMCVHNVIKDTHVCNSLCILGIEELYKEAGNGAGISGTFFLNTFLSFVHLRGIQLTTDEFNKILSPLHFF